MEEEDTNEAFTVLLLVCVFVELLIVRKRASDFLAIVVGYLSADGSNTCCSKAVLWRLALF